MEASKQTGTYVSPSAGKVTVEQVGKQWKSARGHLKASTIANTETAWKRVMVRWGNKEVGNVRTAHVRSWVATMVTEKVGVESIENAFSVLRQIMATAVEDRRVAANPCDSVKLPRREHKHLMCLSHERVSMLAKAVEDLAGGYGLLVLFLAYTGLRIGELAAVKVRCIDLEARRVEVIESVTEVAGELVWSNTKTYERRSVPFPAFLADELRARMAGKGPDAVVFTGHEGGVLRVSNFRPRVFKPALAVCTKADEHFPPVTLRKLRNTAASLAIAEGATVKAVQQMLGHKSAAMTLDTYASLFPSDLDDVADRLDRAASTRTAADDVAALLIRLDDVATAVEAITATHPESAEPTLSAALDLAKGRIAAVSAALREAMPTDPRNL